MVPGATQLAFYALPHSPQRIVIIDKHRVNLPRRYRHNIAGDQLGRPYIGPVENPVTQLAILI